MALVIRTTGLEQFLDDAGEAHLKAFILGEPNAGKTRSSAFWPRPIIASFEEGLLSVADLSVPFAEIKRSSEFGDLLSHLEAECKKPAPERRYATLVIDTLDAFQTKVITREILEPQRKTALSGFADYGQLASNTMHWLNRMLRLPMNVVVNCHIKRMESDADDQPALMAPGLDGSVRDQIAREFDLVGWMRAYHHGKGDERELRREIVWQPRRNFQILKDRSGKLPETTPVRFHEDDYNLLFNTIFGDHLDKLEKSTVVEELEDSADMPDDGKAKGGPVDIRASDGVRQAASARKRAAAKKSVPARQVPAAKKSASPAQAPEKPDDGGNERSEEPEPAATHDEALDNVRSILGGEVKEEPGVDEEKTGEQTRPSKSDGPAVVCGTPAKGAEKTIEGCGKDLRGENRDLINIGLIKHRTYLCNECFKSQKK